MLMAGLYDCATLEGQPTPLWTFTIVTTSANKEFDWLHDRQPVILSTREALAKWLDTSSHTWTSELTKLVQPYHDLFAPLECYQVPKEVGKVGTESPTFIEPVSNRKDGIQAMFMKQTQSQNKLNSPKRSPLKRQRSDSPTKESDMATDLNPVRSSAKKRKSEEKDLVIIEGPFTPTKVQSDSADVSKSHLHKFSSPSPRKSRKKPRDDSAVKITTFFQKHSG